MAMINDLRLVIQNRLNSIKTEYGLTEVSYRVAMNDQIFPHIVYDFTTITPTDMGREDFLLDVHIWTKDQYAAFNILDACRDLLMFWNAPNESILPTFFEMSAGSVDDPDKSIVHLVLRLQVQVYEAGETDSAILGKE
ncbi:MAG: hypothetical protein IKH46_15940 [Lachnospiraceae bacterium]|nr:hypothetical protein [Lachnospiraceae bacterium]